MQHCTFYKLDIYTFCIISQTAIWIDVGSQHLKGLDVRIYIYIHTLRRTHSISQSTRRQAALSTSLLWWRPKAENALYSSAAAAQLHYTTRAYMCNKYKWTQNFGDGNVWYVCVCVLQTAWICFNYIFTFYYNFGLCCSSAVVAAGAHIQVFSLIKTRGVVSNCLLQGALKTLS